jgi:hypothetical protein
MSAGTDSSMQQSAKDKNTGAWSHQKDRKDKRDKRKEAKARKRAYNEQQANGMIKQILSAQHLKFVITVCRMIASLLIDVRSAK